MKQPLTIGISVLASLSVRPCISYFAIRFAKQGPQALRQEASNKKCQYRWIRFAQVLLHAIFVLCEGASENDIPIAFEVGDSFRQAILIKLNVWIKY